MNRTIILASLLAMTACVESEDPVDVEDTSETDVVAGVPYVLNNLELVTENSGYHSTWWRSPTTYCSAGNTLFGLGYIQPYDPSLLFRGTIPIQGAGQYPTAAQASVHEDLRGTTNNWSMTTAGICGRAMSSQQLVKYKSSYNSTALKNVTVACPGTLRVIGAGGTIHYGEGRVKVDEIRPNETLTQVTVYASEDNDGTTGAWEVEAYAICAVAPAGLVRVTATAWRTFDGTPVTASCPPEKRLIGMGGGTDSLTPTSLRMVQIWPASDLRSVTVRAGIKHNGSTIPYVAGNLKAYAICADG
jgi:hypothetical protein